MPHIHWVDECRWSDERLKTKKKTKKKSKDCQEDCKVVLFIFIRIKMGEGQRKKKTMSH